MISLSDVEKWPKLLNNVGKLFDILGPIWNIRIGIRSDPLPHAVAVLSAQQFVTPNDDV